MKLTDSLPVEKGNAITMSTEQKTQGNDVDLSGLVKKPRTQKQAETLAKVADRLSQASHSALIRMALNLSQVERGFTGNGSESGEKKEKPTEITEAQGARISKVFTDHSKEDLVATKMPYAQAWDIVAAIIKAEDAVKGTDDDADYSDAETALEAGLA